MGEVDRAQHFAGPDGLLSPARFCALVNFFFASCQSGLPFKLPVHSPRCWRLGAAVGVRARGFGTITFEWLNLYG